jgi:stearoyl-CoA desaturase (delta-9 desaturase)
VGRPRADLPPAPRDLVDQLDLPLLRAPALRRGDHSTNVWWLALPSFGEAWHHNHHTFPRSAQHGLSRVESSLDPSAWLIAVMEKAGLVWDVVRITPERQQQKLAAGA